jgi:hypothetical protein
MIRHVHELLHFFPRRLRHEMATATGEDGS